MAITKEGAIKIAAKKVGLSVEEYKHRRDSGLKRCTKCKTWKLVRCFSNDKSRWDKLNAVCKDCRQGERTKRTSRPDTLIKSVLEKLYLEEELSQMKIAERLQTTLWHVQQAMIEYDTLARSRSEALRCSQKWRRAPKGRIVDSDGYVMILRPDHPRASRSNRKYVFEHILVVEESTGKPLPEDWIVHHVNGIKGDNRIENLISMPRKGHHPYMVLQEVQVQLRDAQARITELEEELERCQEQR